MSDRSRLAAIALLVGLFAVTLVSGATALTSIGNLNRGDVPVRVAIATAGSLANGSPMPGAPLGPLDLRITADGNLEYGLRPTITGSQALADALLVEIRDEAGNLLYEGPLSAAAINDYFTGGPGRQLGDGASEVLTVTGHIDIKAGNEIAGSDIEITWEVSAKPVLDPA